MARSLSQLFYALGGSVSPGKTNDELVDHLIDAEFLRTPAIQRVFRSVDRGNYYTAKYRPGAYKDVAWKTGNLHMSAPCVYSVVMETLKLKPGHSFLNIGSGTGYLSTMAGLLLGPYGINHGIECHKDVVDYAYEKLDEFLKNNKVVDEHDFCEPIFMRGNCLSLEGNCQQYDRVYCGAACPEEYEEYIKNLVKINGILIMPLNDKLLKMTKMTETEWIVVKVLSVSFAPLVVPAKEEVVENAKLVDFKPPTLLQLCRFKVRSLLRNAIEEEHPKLRDIRRKMPSRRSGLKLFIVNCGEGNEAEESESDGEDLDSFSLLMRSLHRTSFLLRSYSQVESYSSSDRNEESEEEEEEEEDIEDVLKFASLTTVRDATEEEDEESGEENKAEDEEMQTDDNSGGSGKRQKRGTKTSDVSAKDGQVDDSGKPQKRGAKTSDVSTKGVKKAKETADGTPQPQTRNTGRKTRSASKASTSGLSKPEKEETVEPKTSDGSSKAKSVAKDNSSSSKPVDDSAPSRSTRSRTALKRKQSSLDDEPSTSAGCSSSPSTRVTRSSAKKQKSVSFDATANKPAKETFLHYVKLDSNNRVVEEFSHTYFLTQRIAELPLPSMLRKYVNYKRENF